MIILANADPMHALHGGFAHFIGYCMATVTGQTVDTGAHQEMRAERLCFAEKLVNVVLPVANVNQSPRVAQQRRRLAHIFEPAVALLLLDRHPSGVDPPLQRVGALELGTGPEFRRCQA